MSKISKTIIIVIVGIVLLVGFFFLSKLGNVGKVEYKDFINVTSYSQFMERYDHKTELSIIYIGRPTCSACVHFLPTLRTVTTNKDLDVYYINTDVINGEEFTQIINADKFLSSEEWGTPLVMVVGNGKMVSYINDGNTDEAALISFLETAGAL